MRTAGLESSQLILGVDVSKSTEWQGRNSYGIGLHDYSRGPTPFEHAIQLTGQVLENFDDDHIIPFFRFGCYQTRDKSVLPFPLSGVPDCVGTEGVINAYREALPSITMAGPTTMAPMVHKAMELVQQTGEYHILIILTDGDISNAALDAQAIIQARQLPMSIITLGLGDGPFDTLEHFDDHLHSKGQGPDWDNFQFVPFTKLEKSFATCERPDLTLATAILQEIPDQYKIIRKLGLLNRV
ncbi:hypothetical protein KIPB_009521 [Kipferlia bialata]|uniref:VWFA domain-containing protein n=1 Tax=Kipferlia bialata TaxID=797122 RepID=A0A9K3GM68_9EUKA|nr:hypothetical protein KIPB_009521 [Kipferlia bialata]|eukprot:g9521.t1